MPQGSRRQRVVTRNRSNPRVHSRGVICDWFRCSGCEYLSFSSKRRPQAGAPEGWAGWGLMKLESRLYLNLGFKALLSHFFFSCCSNDRPDLSTLVLLRCGQRFALFNFVVPVVVGALSGDYRGRNKISTAVVHTYVRT